MTKSSTYEIPAVILTGGSEILSVSIAIALQRAGIPLVVIALGVESLIRDMPFVIRYRQLQWPPLDCSATVADVINILHQLGAGNPPWPVFATEDSGLRLLFEHSCELSRYLAITGASALPMRGLDKAEFFSFMSARGFDSLIARTITLNSPDDLSAAIDRLGMEIVVKPALKPYSMQADLGGKGQKVLASGQDNGSAMERELRSYWSIAERWVAQEKLHTHPDGEATWYGIRDSEGHIASMSAWIRWQTPPVGGTGCWVESSTLLHAELDGRCRRILAELDYRGIVELSFLQDRQGEWRLLELNPRAWLQLSLAESAGLPITWLAYLDQVGLAPPRRDFAIQHGTSWVNIERIFIAVWRKELGPRLPALIKALKIIIKSDRKAVYESRQFIVCYRWLVRLGVILARTAT